VVVWLETSEWELTIPSFSAYCAALLVSPCIHPPASSWCLGVPLSLEAGVLADGVGDGKAGLSVGKPGLSVGKSRWRWQVTGLSIGKSGLIVWQVRIECWQGNMERGQVKSQD